MTTFDIKKLEKIIGYSFKNSDLAFTAFRHSSYANEKKDKKFNSYERLEFLGDSIVNMIVSEYIFNTFTSLPEGDLTRIRAIVVCEATFYSCAKSMGFGQFLFLGKGEELTGGRDRVSILADIFEAISGAIYLDGGFERAKAFALGQLKGIIHDAVNGTVFMDYKTELQELLQKGNETNISYVVSKETGPDHDKRFEIEVKNNDIVLGSGSGKSKKEAEQSAAKAALKKVKAK